MPYLILTVVILLVLVVALFLVHPSRRRDTRKFEKRLFAHRGYYDNDRGIPENSLAAFHRARAHGYGVELDVQLTKDGEAVVFHDDDLNRMCGSDGHVYDFTLARLRQFRLLKTPEQIPLFADVLRELGGMPVICEIKVPAGQDYRPICEKAAQLMDGYKGDICVESFDPRAVGWFRKNRPDMIRGQLTMNFYKEPGYSLPMRIAMSELLVNLIGRPDFIAWGVDTKETLGLKICRSFRPMMVAWTVCSQQQQDQLLRRYDTAIFERYPAQG